jgi:hypothetical protein
LHRDQERALLPLLDIDDDQDDDDRRRREGRRQLRRLRNADR